MGINNLGEYRAPASATQQQFWLVNQSFPENSAYHIPSLIRIIGPLNISYLEKSLNEVISRHTTLRCFFRLETGKLVQVVKPQLIIDIPFLDLRIHGAERLERQIQDEVAQPFNLKNGPLIRAKIFKTGENEHCFLIIMHHIITDLFSKGKLGIELSKIYNSFISGNPIELEEPSMHYTDYSLFHDQWLRGDECKSMLSYWEKNLEGSNQFLNLPYSFNRPPLQSHKGRTFPFSLSKPFTEKLKTFSRENSANIYLTLLTTYFIILHRYSRQDDITVGVPLSNRRTQDFKNVMGCFVSILPICVGFSGEPVFSQLLKQVRVAMLGAHRNQEVSFKVIVEYVQPKRDPAYNPFFQTGFTFEHPMEIDLNGTVCSSLPVHCGGSQLDLFPVLWESDDGIRGHIEYCTDLFEESAIEGFANHYKNLLREIVDNIDLPVSRLPMLSEKETDQLINRWNNTGKKYPEEDGIHLFFEKQVEKTPDEVAINFNNDSFTYRELNQRANRLAHFLMDRGVKATIPVGIFMERSMEMIVAIYGIIKAGGAYVPLDPAYPKDRLTYMVEDTEAPLILTQEHLAGTISGHNRDLVFLDTQWATVEKYSDTNPRERIKADDPAYIIYTSGSTGKPKGVVNSHRGIINRILWMQDEYNITGLDSVLQKTPYSFDVSVWEFFWPLLVGSKLIIAPPESHKDPMTLIDIINEKKITTLHFVPSMLHAFLENSEVGSCKSLKRVICSGEALSSDLQKRFFESMDAELHNLYGPTEAAVDVTYWACRRDDKRPTVPIGKPIANTKIYILDKYMQPVPVGVPGELFIGGVQVATGYLNLPELTEEKFISDPFCVKPMSRMYKTGDLARFLPDGNIEYIGRNDFQVKVRGVRIELGEIESLISEHQGIAQVVVVGLKYGEVDMRIIAYITLVKDFDVHTPGEVINEAPGDNQNKEVQKWFNEVEFCEDVKNSIRNKLPEHMVPSQIILLEKMPLTQSGKVDRNLLPDPEMQYLLLNHEYVPPKTQTEKDLVHIWSELLNVDKVSVHGNFFEIGGNSLLSAFLVSKIHAKMNIDISVVKLFQYPTINLLASFIDKDETIRGTLKNSTRGNADKRKAALRRMKQQKNIK